MAYKNHVAFKAISRRPHFITFIHAGNDNVIYGQELSTVHINYWFQTGRQLQSTGSRSIQMKQGGYEDKNEE